MVIIDILRGVAKFYREKLIRNKKNLMNDFP
jgi:hypothetical protein